MANTVRIRNGMSNATEGDILGNFGDLVGVGVVDKANGHLLVTEDSPRGMSIQVAGGIVYVPNADYNQLDSDTPKFYPVVCDAEALTIDNNTSGQTRNDIVCVKVDKSIFPDADASNIATKVVVKGTAGGGIPTTPANHYKLANIVVVNGETEITNAEITDTREQVLPEAGIGVVTEDAEQTLTNKTLTAPALSSPTISGAWDGWISAGETWTYASATTFTISGDKTSKYKRGDKIKLTQTTDKYFYVVSATYSNPNTTVTVNGLYLYTLASADITSPHYSRVETPVGYPERKVNLYASTGTTSTITLSETSANFVALEIMYRTSNGSFDSMKIFSPNGLSANLTSGNYYGGDVYIQNCVVSISGTSITFGTNAQVGLGSGGTNVGTGNYIYVTRVDGYRDPFV